MANLDTAAKRGAGIRFPTPSVPVPSGSNANTATERGQLLGRYGALAMVVIVGEHMFVVLHDEVDVGVAQTILVQFKDDHGESISPDAAPTIRVHYLDSTGSETDEVAQQSMTLGMTTGTYYTAWTPGGIRNYVVQVYAARSSTNFYDVQTVSSELSAIAVEIIGNELA